MCSKYRECLKSCVPLKSNYFTTHSHNCLHCAKSLETQPNTQKKMENLFLTLPQATHSEKQQQITKQIFGYLPPLHLSRLT